MRNEWKGKTAGNFMHYVTTPHRKYELYFIFILRMDPFVILCLVLSLLDESLIRFSLYWVPIKIPFIVQLRKINTSINF